MMDFNIFMVPGLNSSGPLHWQTLWEKQFGFTRIQQTEWDQPVCDDWICQVDVSVQSFPAEQTILVGHSLGCCTIAHWAGKYKKKINGALLVGPSDVDAPSYPKGTSGFMPMPMVPLPFPSIMIASSDDYYVSLERARFFAKNWGSEFVNIGAFGHINAASNIGVWPEGVEWLRKLASGSLQLTV